MTRHAIEVQTPIPQDGRLSVQGTVRSRKQATRALAAEPSGKGKPEGTLNVTSLLCVSTIFHTKDMLIEADLGWHRVRGKGRQRAHVPGRKSPRHSTSDAASSPSWDTNRVATTVEPSDTTKFSRETSVIAASS